MAIPNNSYKLDESARKDKINYGPLRNALIEYTFYFVLLVGFLFFLVDYLLPKLTQG
jgi:hypothetical protein